MIWNGIGKIRCNRLWARRKWKDVKIGQRGFFDKPVGIQKILVGFTWKTDHDVRTNRRVWYIHANSLYQVCIVVTSVGAIHRAQDSSGPALHWHVQMMGYPRMRAQ